MPAWPPERSIAAHFGRLIRIDAWRDESETEVRGSFQAVLSPSLFERVQNVRFPKLDRKSPLRRTEPSLDLVLRGHLACPSCSTDRPALTTGSLSRGKLGKRYAYYHCHRCGSFRVRAEEAHDAFRDFLRTLQISSDVAALYRAVVHDIARQSDAERKRSAAQLQRELTEIETKLFAADEALVEGRIGADSHSRMKQRYDQQALAIRGRLAELTEIDDEKASQVEAAANLFQVLPLLWSEALQRGDAEAASDLVGSIAPEKITYDEDVVRTPFGSSAIALFDPESYEIENAGPNLDPASCQACLTGRWFEPPTISLLERIDLFVYRYSTLLGSVAI